MNAPAPRPPAEEMRERVTENARVQQDPRSYLESCIKHGGEIGKVAFELYESYLTKLDYQI
jgi:hypothetical protein